MNRKKGKENKREHKSLIDHKDLERNVLTEISKELNLNNANKQKGNKWYISFFYVYIVFLWRIKGCYLQVIISIYR